MVRYISLLLFIGLAWGQPTYITYDFFFDSLATGLEYREDGTLHLGVNNQFDFVNNTYVTGANPPVLLVSSVDAAGNVITTTEIVGIINQGDIIHVQNESQTKIIQFTATGTITPYDPMHGIFYEPASFSFSSSNGIPFLDNEPVTFINTSVSTGLDDEVEMNFSLHQNHPNPFNPVTTLQYDLPEDALVNITIYDMMGRVVSNLVSTQQNAGYKSIQWNATNNIGQPVSAGLYLYTIQAGKFRQTKKMVLLK
jgi:hypothetical protein